MYCYHFTLTPSRNKSTINFSEYTALFVEAVENVNNGIAFKRDGKTLSIDCDQILPKTLSVTLSSVNQLKNPARSLSSLTRYLTKSYPDTFEPFIYNKTIFNIKLESQSCSTSLNKEEMTNEELLKAIIDLLYTEKPSNKKDTAINQIKDIVKEFI